MESRRGRFGGTFVTYTPPAPSRVELRRIAVEDADKINDALTFRMAVEAPVPPGSARPGGRQRPGRPRRELLARSVALPKWLCAVNNATPGDYRRLDTLFHLAIARTRRSSLLASACAEARVRLNDLLNAIPLLQRNIDHTARPAHRGHRRRSWLEATRGATPSSAVAEHLDRHRRPGFRAFLE